MQKLFQRRGVKAEVKRENVRVRETQRDEAPDARQGDVVLERGIADMLHPVVIVVHGVVHAVVARKIEVDHWPAEMIEEHRVVGAAADACFHQRAVERRSASLRIAHRRGAPCFVQRFAGWRANIF